MVSTFTQIPILDLSLANSPSTRPALIRDLRFALTEIGFLYVSNHGIPEPIIQNLTRALPTLFALPQHEKEAVTLHNSQSFLGYGGVGSERTAKQVDEREQFEFATELPDDFVKGDPEYKKLYGPNQWPATYPEIQEIVSTYINSLTSLSTNFLTLVAEALELSPASLESYLSRQHRLKVVRYPAPVAGTDADVQGVGPHKDSSGWWTFLLQASPPPIGGLQVLNRAGQWIDVPSVPGTFVVNIGQAFEVVSGGLCPATTHRVISGGTERFSVPFFQGVRGDAGKSDFGALWKELEAKQQDGRKVDGELVDSAYLRGRYDTWGEWQLRTKIRSHPDVGKKFYSDVSAKYLSDE